MATVQPKMDVPAVFSEHSKAYRERRRKQMMLFFGTTATTLLFARIAHRGVQSRRYIPSLFNANHIPPPFSFQRDAILAVAHASGLALSGFAMGVTGLCWSWDVSTPKEFGYKLKKALGGDANEQKILEMPLDDEYHSVQEAINKILNGEDLSEEIDAAVNK